MKETSFDIIVEEHRFFDHWLKGINNGVMKEAPVTYFTYNQTPEKAWQTAKSWPLPSEKRTAYYLGDKVIAPAKPDSKGILSTTVDYDINDKNFFEKGLSFVTEPLSADVQVTGHPVLKLWIASSSKDADIVARIDDVAPDGTNRYYWVEGRLRASLRKLETAPYNNLGLPWHPFTEASVQPLAPNQAVEVEFDFFPISYLFKQGHRIRLTINFADARATAKETPAPQITVHHGGERASVLTLPIIPQS